MHHKDKIIIEYEEKSKLVSKNDFDQQEILSFKEEIEHKNHHIKELEFSLENFKKDISQLGEILNEKVRENEDLKIHLGGQDVLVNKTELLKEELHKMIEALKSKEMENDLLKVQLEKIDENNRFKNKKKY